MVHTLPDSMTSPLEKLAATVDEWLLRLDADTDVTAEGFWSLRYGSTLLILSSFEHEGATYLRMGAVVLSGAHASLEVVLRLLRLNAQVLFGSFQLFDDDTIAFTHTLPAEGLTFESFSTALTYISRVADDNDEELQSLAGGRRGEDMLAEPVESARG